MRSGAALSLVALFAVACGPKAPLGPIVAESAKDQMPEQSPGEKATLRLGGSGAKPGKGALPDTEFEVSLVHDQKGTEETILLQTQGETLEREVYETSAGAFRILAASDDSFAPGIDLIRFPAHEHESWDWSGKVIYAGTSRPAQAKIALSKEGDALISDVRLEITADPGRPDLQRRLKFWFQKGKGVTRRTFGGISDRRPVGESWQP